MLSLAVLVAIAGTAAAKGWPTPAAGESASGDPEILFTFDDGPSPTTTPKVLDTLKAHRVRAVFFLVGEMTDSQNKKVAPIVQRILREGHVLASHTMHHKDLCRAKLQDTAAASDIDDGIAAIEKVAKVKLVWFRTPFGARCQRLEDLLAERKLQHFHWDLDPQEWKHDDPAKAFSYVTGSLARSSDRNVLLMHDIKTATVKSLPQILEWIETENKKRSESGKRQIRILQAPMLAVEQLPKGFAAWSADAKARVVGLRTALASVLP
ncbi:MAG: polysaccharide deacetylase family protein [Deltaproteobacteria bacterium]|nr:polysaccharide deacetylase family protein [Deltaproteobacteria bacterium]